MEPRSGITPGVSEPTPAALAATGSVAADGSAAADEIEIDRASAGSSEVVEP